MIPGVQDVSRLFWFTHKAEWNAKVVKEVDRDADAEARIQPQCLPRSYHCRGPDLVAHHSDSHDKIEVAKNVFSVGKADILTGWQLLEPDKTEFLTLAAAHLKTFTAYITICWDPQSHNRESGPAVDYVNVSRSLSMAWRSRKLEFRISR